MQVRDLIKILRTLDLDADVVFEDLNGLHWRLDPEHVRFVTPATVVLGTKDVNQID